MSTVPLTLLSQEMAVPSAPYLFDSTEQGSCVAYEHLATTLGDLMDGAGVLPLTWTEVGHYVIFSKEPTSTPADLQGNKMRIASSIADAAFAKSLGVSGVPMVTSDAIPALQTGAIDAVWFPSLFGIGIGTLKVAPHVPFTNHARLIGTVGISKRTVEKFGDQKKQWLGIFTAADGWHSGQLSLRGACTETMRIRADRATLCHYLRNAGEVPINPGVRDRGEGIEPSGVRGSLNLTKSGKKPFDFHTSSLFWPKGFDIQTRIRARNGNQIPPEWTIWR